MKSLCFVCVLAFCIGSGSQVFSEAWVIPGGETELRLNVGRIPTEDMVAKIQSGGGAEASLFDTLPSIGMSKLDAETESRKGFKIKPAPSNLMPYVEWRPLDDLSSNNMKKIREIIPGCSAGIGLRLNSRGEAWEFAYDCLKSLAMGRSSLEKFIDKGNALYVIEPVLDLENHDFIERRKSALSSTGEEVKLSESPPKLSDTHPCLKLTNKTEFTGVSPVWPSSEPGWHLDPRHSQLIDAYQTVFPSATDGPSDVVVAHLDTGYFPCDTMLPKHFDKATSYSCDASGCEKGKGEASQNLGWPYFPNSPWHGAATLSNLAGGEYTYSNGSKYVMGGNPKAKVFSVHISDSYIHLDSRAMGLGIETAVAEKADVITLSAGGLPSARLVAAVNHAYLSGTSIIAATGDFIALPLDIARTPSQVVYPARYSRVMGVAGVTMDHESYGDAPSIFWWLNFGRGYFSNIASWMLRGSYGPASVMSRNVVTAYAPNITRSVAEKGKNNIIGNNGAGTSHAAPQVAAAASLWIQNNRKSLNQIADPNRLWEKSEAVYRALSESAYSCFTDYDVEHYGRGVLRAKDALDWTYESHDGNGYIVKKQLGTSPTSKIHLTLKKEADLDMPGVLDALRSARLPGPHRESVRNAFAYALFTELTQIALTSETLQEYLQRFNICKPMDGCEVCRREEFNSAAFLKGLEKIVRNLHDASSTLKAALRDAALSNS